jgi:hypothetical protein
MHVKRIALHIRASPIHARNTRATTTAGIRQHASERKCVVCDVRYGILHLNSGPDVNSDPCAANTSRTAGSAILQPSHEISFSVDLFMPVKFSAGRATGSQHLRRCPRVRSPTPDGRACSDYVYWYAQTVTLDGLLFPRSRYLLLSLTFFRV